MESQSFSNNVNPNPQLFQSGPNDAFVEPPVIICSFLFI